VPPKRRLRWAVLPVGIATAAILAGCTPTELHGYLPGFVEDGTPATNHTDMVAGLWVNSWIVLLVVGIITWGLMGWAAIAYRRRKGQVGLPVQLRYNMPIEIFYTVVPLILVIGFFAFTARDQTILETQTEDPDVSIIAIGVQASPAANGDVDQEKLPTLYLPVNKSVKILLQSRDVIHSFWVIDFLYKKDMYIGRDNYWSFTPTREGTYAGKCAELCGEYHSAMLFNVKVVSEAEYEDYLASLEAAGQTGDINDEYDRLQNEPGTGASPEGDE
jgi:cytochrome c oxidase subunit II